MMSGNHYDSSYFNWQKKIGEFGGKANLFKFEKYISKELKVVDFGCGGGFLLKNINCVEKVGIEINEIARQNAEMLGIKTFSDISELERESTDIVISNHALEHVSNPLSLIKAIKNILKPGGKFVCVVPHEVDEKFSYEDKNKHLFTWSPQNLLNLFIEAGYSVEKVERIYHTWPINFILVQKLFGWKIFHLICKMKSRILRKGFQTRIIGVKKER